MKNLTSSSARRWGTLLLLVAGSVGSIGTASAQQGGAGRSSEASWRQREIDASDRLALVAHERTLLEEAAQWAAVERGLAEQARQQVVLEARQQVDQNALVQAHARRERREAGLARIRAEQAWVTLRERVRVEQRALLSAPDGKRFASEPRVAVRIELGRHAQRKAYLVRLRELAVEEPIIVGRLELLFDREQRQHQRTLNWLGVTGR